MTDHTAAGALLDTDEPTGETAQDLARLTTWMTEVVSADDLSPTLRRVVLSGPFEDFRSFGADQFVYTIVPRSADGHLPDGFDLADMTEAHTAAYYTIRRWDPARGEVELWMVRHADPGGVAGWSQRCRIGDRAALWGPRRGAPRPAEATRHLLVSDDSGLAAVAARLDDLADDHTALVLAETRDRSCELTLTNRANVEVRWFHRHTADPGTGDLLANGLRALGLEHQDLAGWSVFGAGERRQVSALRRYLRHHLGMAPHRVHLTAYWSRGGW